MAKTTGKQLAINKVVTKVRLSEDTKSLGTSNSGVWKNDDLDETGLIDVFGWEWKDYGDGSGHLCFIVLNKKFVLASRAVEMFEIVDWKDEESDA